MRSTPEIIVVGTSFGGLSALQTLLPSLPTDFSVPICIVQHRSRDADHGLSEFLQKQSQLPIREPDDKEEIRAGTIYLAPRDYHLLVQPGSFALSVEAPVSYARPSVDVLFESAADAYRERTLGVILTGANRDGAQGAARIKSYGGVCIVQDPADAAAPQMPQAALDALIHAKADYVLPISDVADCLLRLCGQGSAARERMVARG